MPRPITAENFMSSWQCNGQIFSQYHLAPLFMVGCKLGKSLIAIDQCLWPSWTHQMLDYIYNSSAKPVVTRILVCFGLSACCKAWIDLGYKFSLLNDQLIPGELKTNA